MLEEIYSSRPFKIRNADEFDLSTILDLFVDPTESLHSPFDYENVIVKGRMGTGKTMYLRANHAFYLYNIVPSLINGATVILPIYIRLSDFQHISSAKDIYCSIIIKIIEEMNSVYEQLQDANIMANIHKGICNLPLSVLNLKGKLRNTYKELLKLNSDEYIQEFSSELGVNAGVASDFFAASIEAKENDVLEIRHKPTPSISDVNSIFKFLTKGIDGKILILLDEAGSINKSFFNEKDGSSLFEILMNQFRTADYIRTKIAVYPESYSDILTETRYGDTYHLQEDITTEKGIDSFTHRGLVLIEKYISSSVEGECQFEDLFDIKEKDSIGTDALEQLINASSGNMRRFVQLLDQTMICAYDKNRGQDKIKYENAIEALNRHGKSMEDEFNSLDKEFLYTLVKACKSRQAYIFKFPNKAPALYKYTYKSSEANILNIVELGTGRKSTTYSFDYAYCVYTGLATHFLKGSEKIDKLRSRNNGDWIKRVTTLSDELLDHASFPGKIEGEINWFKDESGFISGDDGKEYFWAKSFIIEHDRSKRITHGKRVRFFPIKLEDSTLATEIEVL